MSNALTELSPDHPRSRSYYLYLDCLADLVANPNEGNRDKTIKAAQAAEAFTEGYFSRNTNLASCAEHTIAELLSGERSAWARLLASVEDDSQAYARFYELSPFRGVVVTAVSYGMGFIILGAELKRQLSEAIQSQGHETWNCQTYVIAIPRLRPEDAEIILLSPLKG